MNYNIKRAIDKVWETASNDFYNKPFGEHQSARELLVKDTDNPWGQPIEEVVDIVVSDIEGMPWSDDAYDEVALEFNVYFKELRKQARKKFFENKSIPDP